MNNNELLPFKDSFIKIISRYMKEINLYDLATKPNISQTSTDAHFYICLRMIKNPKKMDLYRKLLGTFKYMLYQKSIFKHEHEYYKTLATVVETSDLSQIFEDAFQTMIKFGDTLTNNIFRILRGRGIKTKLDIKTKLNIKQKLSDIENEILIDIFLK